MAHNCKTCGSTHEELPALGFKGPDYADLVPENQRLERVKIDDELCAVDDEIFFIRATLAIPIKGYKDDLNFSIWVSLDKNHFLTYIQQFNSSEIGPFFGWLANEFNFHDESTLNMKTMVHFQSGGLRPFIKLEELEHPLSIAQQNGITLDEAWEIAHQYKGLSISYKVTN